MKKIIIYMLSIISLWCVIHIILISFDGLKDELHISDVCVILGNKVEQNGQPSKRLKSRLDRSIWLYKNKYFKYVIVSGGTGREGFNEAKVMKEYLVKKGIPEGKIFQDSKGTNTFMTAENSKNIMDKMKFKSVIIVSQFYHITRVKLAFKEVGVKHIYSAHAKFFEVRDVYSLVREVPAYYKYLFSRK